MISIFIICLLSSILLIWFKTNVLIEYIKLTRSKKLINFFKIKEYQNFKESENIQSTYHIFLKTKYSCFFTRLITCPICLNVWLSTFICLLLNQIIFIPIAFIFSMFIYLIISWIYDRQ